LTPSYTVPPNAIEIEEALIGGLLLDPDAFDRIRETINQKSFYVPAHGDIWKTIEQVASANQPIDLLTVTAQLEATKQLEGIGGRSKLAALLERTVSAVNCDKYAQILADKAARRQLITAASTASALAYDENQPLATVLDASQQAIYNVSTGKQNTTLASIDTVARSVLAEIEACRRDGVQPGLITGLAELDGITGGFGRGDLIIIAGRPSMGKTSLGLQIAASISAIYELPALIFSLEMSSNQLVQRLIAAEAEVQGDRLRSGRLSDDGWAAVAKAVAKIKDSLLYIEDAPSISIASMRATARRVVATSGKSLGCVLVDYLQLLGGDKPENRVEELAAYTRGLKALAREFNVPLIALSQLSRGVESRNDKRPMMSDLRSSGAIEQDADLIAAIYRDSYYQQNSRPTKDDPTELGILKHRNGPTGKLNLLFDSACSKFKDTPARLF
jgi:replicative DNA helicase